MGQLQFRADDSPVKWTEGFGSGADGDLTISSNTTEAPIDASCTATAGTTSISATNASFATGQIIMIHKSRGSTTTAVGTWELNKIASYTAGTITTVYQLQNSYQDSGADQSQVRVLKQYNNVTVNNGITYTAKAWNGDVGGILAFLAKGTCTVTGNISAASTGYRPGLYYGGDGAPGGTGEGTSGASVNQYAANGNGGGGAGKAGGAYAAGAGGGGHSSAGGNGTASSNTPTGTVGTGGGTSGVAALTIMTFGGGGGTGGNWPAGAATNNAIGGGIVLIIASAIIITGTIVSTGGPGTGGTAHGGGAAGSILIKTKVGTLGTTLVTASGGSGASQQPNNGIGGNGSAGRIHLDYKTSYTGTTNPTLDATQDATLDYPFTGNFFMFFN